MNSAALARDSISLIALPVVPVLISIAIVNGINNGSDDQRVQQARVMRCEAAVLMHTRADLDGALACYEHARVVENSLCFKKNIQPSAYYDCARIYIKRKRYELAESVLEEGIAKLKRYIQSNTSPQERHFAQTDILRAYTLRGEILFSRGNYERASQSFAYAITSGAPLHETTLDFSDRTGLRLAGRGWCKCPQNRAPNGEPSPAAVRELLHMLPEQDRDCLGSIIDTSTIDRSECKKWNEVLKEADRIQDTDRATYLKDLDRYVNATPDRPLATANRLMLAAHELGFTLDHALACSYLTRAIDLRLKEPAPNWVIIAELQRRLAMSQTMQYNNPVLAAATLKKSLDSIRKILPAQQVPMTATAAELARKIFDMGDTAEALRLAHLEYNYCTDRFAQNSISSDTFANAASFYCYALRTNHQAARADQICTQTMDLLLTKRDASAVASKLLGELQRHLWLSLDSVADENEKIRICSYGRQLYQRYRPILPEHRGFKGNLVVDRKMEALILLLQKNYDKAIAVAEGAIPLAEQLNDWPTRVDLLFEILDAQLHKHDPASSATINQLQLMLKEKPVEIGKPQEARIQRFLAVVRPEG